MLKTILCLVFSISLFAGLNGKTKLRLAGLQMNVTKNILENKIIILEGIRNAASNGANYLITPEGSLSGYHSNFDQIELDSALEEILEEAKNNNIGLFLGTCYFNIINEKEYCFNQIRFYSPTGIYLGAHSKILLCSPLEYPGTGEITDYVQGELRTFTSDEVNFGALICNDLWASPGFTTLPNTYLPWQLKKLGAQIIIHSMNSGYKQRYRKFHESSSELWAYALNITIMQVNAAKQEKQINASSGVINGEGVREVIVPDVGEQLFYYDLDVSTLNKSQNK